jgi:hypothetical protein
MSLESKPSMGEAASDADNGKRRIIELRSHAAARALRAEVLAMSVAIA